MHTLNIIPDVLIAEEEFDYLMTQLNFLDICGWLFEPLFQQSSANLSTRLI